MQLEYDFGVGGDGLTADAPRYFERNDMFLEQTRHFLDVLRGEAQPLCSLQDGIQALRLALAALESAQQGILISL